MLLASLLFVFAEAAENPWPNVFWVQTSVFQSDKSLRQKSEFCQMVLLKAKRGLKLSIETIAPESVSVIPKPIVWPGQWKGSPPMDIAAWNRSVTFFEQAKSFLPGQSRTDYKWTVLSAADQGPNRLVNKTSFIPAQLGPVLGDRFDSVLFDGQGQQVKDSDRHVVLLNQPWDQALVNGANWEDPIATPSYQIRVFLKDGRMFLTPPIESRFPALAEPDNVLLVIRSILDEAVGVKARIEDYVAGVEFATTLLQYEFIYARQSGETVVETFCRMLCNSKAIRDAQEISARLPKDLFFSTRVVVSTGYSLAVVFRDGAAL